ncbi:hypothetical protein KM043_007712 [Ampulex compressa]|nr:hypothetical protein KM043_007712 [Ampulex compressa]
MATRSLPHLRSQIQAQVRPELSRGQVPEEAAARRAEEERLAVPWRRGQVALVPRGEEEGDSCESGVEDSWGRALMGLSASSELDERTNWPEIFG